MTAGTAEVAPDRTDRPARDLVARIGGELAAGAWAGRGIVGVGVDAVDLDRFAATLARRPRLAERLFSVDERDYAAAAPDPVPRLATRFAAKEAVMKALGVGLWSFRLTDVEVARDGLEAPTLVLTGGAADLAGARGVARWHLSLTHTDAVAVAVVVAEAGFGAGTDDPAPEG